MKKSILITSVTAMLLLSGCFLPAEERAENRVAYPDQLQAVQQAVEQFQTDTGVLPIKNFEETTSLYNRYVVDFNQLIPRYIQNPPGTAFENGGVFQYVLVNVEEEPEVKVIDLTSMREIQQMQSRLNDYMREHDYAPIEEVLDHGLFLLDYEALKYDSPPYVRSPYFETSLPLLLTNEGEIIIDYRIDINIALQEYDHKAEEGEDLRPILYQNAPFVPARSIPYSLDENGEPKYDMELE